MIRQSNTEISERFEAKVLGVLDAGILAHHPKTLLKPDQLLQDSRVLIPT